MRRESQRGKSPKEDDGHGRGRPATSFTVGAIALVFLATGYQTALFIHRASIARITANRDVPDTVYVYQDRGQSPDAGLPAGSGTAYEISGGNGSSEKGGTAQSRRRSSTGTGKDTGKSSGKSSETGTGKDSGTGKNAAAISIKSASHSPAAMKVREKYGKRTYESFRFDPNTASIEDLMRLGFSQKQAQSIDKYRKSGGRFRRREDFAKSFVVADSVYARLEPFIDIPRTDINRADSAAFDALPGIGPYYAARMIEYRNRLGGYSRTEQLLEIKGIDSEKYEKFADLVYAGDFPPFRLWTLPEDSLALHPYIGKHAARGIVLFRDNNPASKWSVENLARAGVIPEEDAERLSLCRIETPRESP